MYTYTREGLARVIRDQQGWLETFRQRVNDPYRDMFLDESIRCRWIASIIKQTLRYHDELPALTEEQYWSQHKTLLPAATRSKKLPDGFPVRLRFFAVVNPKSGSVVKVEEWWQPDLGRLVAQ